MHQRTNLGSRTPGEPGGSVFIFKNRRKRNEKLLLDKVARQANVISSGQITYYSLLNIEHLAYPAYAQHSCWPKANSLATEASATTPPCSFDESQGLDFSEAACFVAGPVVVLKKPPSLSLSTRKQPRQAAPPPSPPPHFTDHQPKPSSKQMRKLQQRKSLHSRVFLIRLSVTLTLLLLLLFSSGIDVSDATHANTYKYYQRTARVYEHRSAQYVNPAVIRQQLEQRKRDVELAWQRRLAEMARIRSDAELKARELKIRNEWKRKWRQYK